MHLQLANGDVIKLNYVSRIEWIGDQGVAKPIIGGMRQNIRSTAKFRFLQLDQIGILIVGDFVVTEIHPREHKRISAASPGEDITRAANQCIGAITAEQSVRTSAAVEDVFAIATDQRLPRLSDGPGFAMLDDRDRKRGLRSQA